MATVIPMQKRLQVRFHLGMDADFNPIYSLRSWANVNLNVTDAALLTLGTNLGQLCEHNVDRIQVNIVNELEAV